MLPPAGFLEWMMATDSFNGVGARDVEKAHHAPKDGVTVEGKKYLGGQFVPEVGSFGPISLAFIHDADGAIKHLMAQKDGEAIAALHHPEIGDIDIVWGKEGTREKDFRDGSGLAKIAKKHPEVLADLQKHLLGMTVNQKRSGQNRKRLESPTHQASVRLDWDGKSKNWLLTAYENETG